VRDYAICVAESLYPPLAKKFGNSDDPEKPLALAKKVPLVGALKVISELRVVVLASSFDARTVPALFRISRNES
jgi:hypothetical protein